MIGAATLLFGAASRMFLPEYYAYIYIAGSILFAVSQFLLRPRNASVTLRRLVIQQQLGGILLVASGVAMILYNNNEWIVLLSCGALIELYTAFRIPREIEKQK